MTGGTAPTGPLAHALVAIRAAHTAVWAFFVACIFGIWLFAWRGDYPAALWAISLVSLEVAVLGLNRWHCPLTPLAARYTTDTHPGFDIYLPRWLARHTKSIFGSLYIGGVALALVRWASIVQAAST